ncbi:MAG: acyl-ACP--UDP-N-acetylglucosamine O-acyltransferase [Bacteroidales bacterium]|jgi:UDP-N-acetylglucosamine acyltransferase|nr:acyl-ACP--UDP-N-acetylglucosamine O-acyltransferase [Bacteroidales bacterium]
MTNKLFYIHPEAIIAQSVEIGPFSYIDKNVVIDEGTWIGPNVTILEGSRIGKNCKIFPGAVIGAIPQDLKFRGEETLAIIGDDTTIRECVTINRGTAAKEKTLVGSNCLLMAYVHVAHDCVVGNNVILVNGTTLGGEVEIDDWAIISANTLIHQFCKIGKHVILAGNSLVGKDIPPYVKGARCPISYAGINSVGLRRRNFKDDKINEIQDIYRIIFNKGLPTVKAVETIYNKFPETNERNEILNFIENSSRGIIKGYFDQNKVYKQNEPVPVYK